MTSTSLITNLNGVISPWISSNASLLLGNTSFDALKNILFIYVIFKRTIKIQRHLRARGIYESVKDVWRWVQKKIILLALNIPSLKAKVDKELGDGIKKIESMFIPINAEYVRYTSLPIEGRSPEWIEQEMEKMDTMLGGKELWQRGKLSGAVYHGGDDNQRVILNAFTRYCLSNPLHPDAFPSVRKMEAEVVAMCLRMYNNPNGAGTTTSGGTESIIMAVKAHRDWGRATKGITEPEIVVPVSAHAAFDKAGHYLNVKVHMVPVDPNTRKVNIAMVKRAINPNTVMIVGSAVNFPDGCMDDITTLSRIAKQYKVGLHVDCCLGSFIVPFVEKAGYSIDPFDFRLEGVTSISCDTHKYGFAPKGSSVIMYRNTELRRYQYYIMPDWTGGVYGSPSIAGSRPGALIAGTWAVMQYMGEEGYIKSCRTIVGCAKKIEAAITSEIPELYVLGKPPASVVAFASNDSSVSIWEVGDKMSQRGWHLNAITKPAGLHIACTRLTIEVSDTFIADLKDCIQEARAEPSGKGSMVALYGLGQASAVGPEMVEKLAAAFIDTMFKA